jgi:hypothetical protein
LAELCPESNPAGIIVALSSLLLSFESWDSPAPCRISFTQKGVLYESVLLHPELGEISGKQHMKLSTEDLAAAPSRREWLERQLYTDQRSRVPGLHPGLSLILLRAMVTKLENKYGTDKEILHYRCGKGVFSDP